MLGEKGDKGRMRIIWLLNGIAVGQLDMKGNLRQGFSEDSGSRRDFAPGLSLARALALPAGLESVFVFFAAVLTSPHMPLFCRSSEITLVEVD